MRIFSWMGTWGVLAAAIPPALGLDLPPVEPGFKRLFNGKDLSGWKVVNGEAKAWKVENGELRAAAGGNWLAYQQPVGDFILRLDWRVSKDGNSGVFFRVPNDACNDPWVLGFEAQISNAPRDEAHCTGSLYGVVAVNPRPDETHEVWHSYEISAIGKQVRVRIDGVECVASSYENNAEMAKRPLQGFIGLQDYHAGNGGTIEYRNIRLSEVNAEGLAPGFRRLVLPGKPSGWHKIRSGHGTGGDWKLVGETWEGEQDPPGSGNGGILVTDGRYGDFELVIEANPDWGCDSGVFLRSNPRGQCYQIMVDYYRGGNVGSIYGEGCGGFTNRNYNLDESKSAVPVGSPAGNIAFPIAAGEWRRRWKDGGTNEIRARIAGNPPVIEVWLNGVYLTLFQDTQVRQELEADGKGHLGIQVHGGKSWPEGAKVRYRNIQVREIEK
ncbi:MAG: DUF1080 domain-containing protein [Planctomycetes bacterium]|nr:DUF1080 domain-containing protein [Planctomycetota bacterium]